MSKYFKALRRLQTGSVDPVAQREGVRLQEIEVPQESGLPFPALPLANRQAAFARLLDFLRARVRGATQRAVVVAGVSERPPDNRIVWLPAPTGTRSDKARLRLM